MYDRGKKLSKSKTQNKINDTRNTLILKKNKIEIEYLQILGHFLKQKREKRKREIRKKN